MINKDMFNINNASQSISDIYSEFKSESKNLTLREIIDNL